MWESKGKPQQIKEKSDSEKTDDMVTQKLSDTGTPETVGNMVTKNKICFSGNAEVKLF